MIAIIGPTVKPGRTSRSRCHDDAGLAQRHADGRVAGQQWRVHSGYSRSSGVERKQPERLTACASDPREVALVGAQELQGPVAVRQDDDRRVPQSNAKVGVPLHDSLGVADILGREQLELIGATRDLVDERHLRLVTDSAVNQVVQFREHKG